MPEQQTMGEIVRLAIRREEEAYAFLMAMSKCAKSPSIRQMLEAFAVEELEHKDKLQLELLKLGEVVPQEQESPPDDTYFIESRECAYIDYEDLLRLAIEKEDISFRLYISLAAQVQQEEARETFLYLAEEELRHKIRFETEYDQLHPSR